MPASDLEQKLLSLVTDLEQFSQEKRFPSRLNILQAAGMHRQEIRHSNFLAFLLRPQNPMVWAMPFSNGSPADWRSGGGNWEFFRCIGSARMAKYLYPKAFRRRFAYLFQKREENDH